MEVCLQRATGPEKLREKRTEKQPVSNEEDIGSLEKLAGYGLFGAAYGWAERSDDIESYSGQYMCDIKIESKPYEPRVCRFLLSR